MNNYCRNCGEKLTNNDICEKCGTKVLTNRMGELDRPLANKYIKIFIALVAAYFIIYPITLNGFSALYGLNNIIPIVLITFVIYAKKKLKYSLFFNIIFWIMLLLFIAYILLILTILISCEYQF